MLLLAACGDDGPTPPEGPATVERQTFVEAYVDLREAALLHGGELSDSLRTAVLERHDVTARELLRFAEVRGTDIGYMRDVWAEVERLLEARKVPPDSVAGS